MKRGNDDFVGYCGGIDLNPDRLDDARHLIKAPYHDVHARFEGPAVRDLALTFEERWTRDGGGDAAAFATPTAASLGTPGATVVQIGADLLPGRRGRRARLAFAPQGDRTINDTLLRAIAAAREFIYIEDQYFTPPPAYRAALTAKVASGEIKRARHHGAGHHRPAVRRDRPLRADQRPDGRRHGPRHRAHRLSRAATTRCPTTTCAPPRDAAC